MFQSITWGEYIHCLFISIPIYYVVVLALYFRQDIVRLFKGRKIQRRPGERDDDLVDSP